MKVTLRDYAIGPHASSLVKDGGTLQIGIGSLGDAIAHRSSCTKNPTAAISDHPADLRRATIRSVNSSRFDEGLYGASGNVRQRLRTADRTGTRREVFSDPTLQRLLVTNGSPPTSHRNAGPAGQEAVSPPAGAIRQLSEALAS